MSTSDDFSTYVADLLSGTYDCVDRICVRGYFPLGQTSGGLLTWWNQLFPNTQLSEQRLRKLAGGFAPRVHTYARKHKIPLRYFAIGDKTKHAQAQKLRPVDPKFRGVFAIFVAKTPALVWQRKNNPAGNLVLPRPPKRAARLPLPISYCRPPVGKPHHQDEWSPALWLANFSQWA